MSMPQPKFFTQRLSSTETQARSGCRAFSDMTNADPPILQGNSNTEKPASTFEVDARNDQEDTMTTDTVRERQEL